MKLSYKYKSLWYSFKRIDSFIKWILLISIGILLNFECRILTLPTRLSFLIGANKVLVQILYAFLTGFIFYFIIDFLHQEKKRVSIFRMLSNCEYYLKKLSSDLIAQVCVSNRITSDQEITFNEFSKLCSKINIHTAGCKSWYFGRNTYYLYINKYCRELKRNVDEIIIFYDLLNEEWSASLANILDNIKQTELHLNVNGQLSTLDFVSRHLWNNYIEAEKLYTLFNHYLKGYWNQSKEKFPPGKSYIPKESTFKFTIAASKAL